jgi:hypothetical protein
MVDPPDDAIRKQLRRILASKWFRGRNRDNARALLEHVVEQTLKGNAEGLKERNLAVDVFNRGDGFDGGVDSVVRSTAGRVRGKLLAYYSANPTDTVVIDIPIGGYAPEFSLRHGHGAGAAPVFSASPAPPEESRQESDRPESHGSENDLRLISKSTPTLPSGPEWAATSETEFDELGQTPSPPTRISLTSKHGRIIALSAMLLTACLSLVVWWRLRPPRLPTNKLVVGLAEFSPPTPATERFRNGIRDALENGKYGGPKVDVHLLDAELNASQVDLQDQAREISHNRVHIVLGAAASGKSTSTYRPRMVLVRPFLELTRANHFAALLEGLQIKVSSNEEDEQSPAAEISVSDLVKLIYSFQYFEAHDVAKLENVLKDLDDTKLGTLIWAACLYELANRGTEEGLANLRKSLSLVNSLIGSSPEKACTLDPSDDHLNTCQAVYVRSLITRMIAIEVADVDRPPYIGRSLLDADYAERFFANRKDRKRVWEIWLNRAEVYTILGNISILPERIAWFLKAKEIAERVLAQASRYDPNPPGSPEVRYDLAVILDNLAGVQEDHREDLASEARAQLQQGLTGCAEDDPPGYGSTTITGAFQKVRNRWRNWPCLATPKIWSAIKGEQLHALSILSGTLADDGSYDEEALADYRAATRFVTEKNMPLEWAYCNLMLSGVYLAANDGDSSSRERQARRLMALAASNNALRIFQGPRFSTSWVTAKIYAATAHLQLSEITEDSREREEHRQAARELLRDITSRMDSRTLRALGFEKSLADLSKML